MILPLLVIAAVTAGAQWMNSQQAQKASKEERERIQGLIDGIKDPNFDPKDFTSEQYAAAAKFVPEIASYVEEKNPQLVKATASGQAGMEAQMAAVGRLRDLATSGEDVQSRLLTTRALGDAANQNAAQQRTIQQNAAQRGLGGSGLEFMQSMIGQQGSNQAATRAGQDAAMNAYQTKIQAMKDSGTLGGQMRQQDFSEQAKNADIINSFNQRQAQNANSYNQYVAGVNNDASRYNIGNQNRIAEANTGLRNADLARQRGRNDMIENARYTAQTNKANLGIGQGANNLNAINQNANMNANMIGGAGQAAGSYYDYSNTQDRNAQNQRNWQADYDLRAKGQAQDEQDNYLSQSWGK